MGESPKPITNFKGAIDSLLGGKRVKRLEWPNDGTFLAIQGEQLSIYKPDKKAFAPLIVSVGDMMGEDWVVVDSVQ